MSEERKLTYPEICLSTAEGGKALKFEPQKDITPWECTKITELLVYIAFTRRPCDWKKFVDDHQLHRHFIETEIEEE